jgi:hypothetical protein
MQNFRFEMTCHLSLQQTRLLFRTNVKNDLLLVFVALLYRIPPGITQALRYPPHKYKSSPLPQLNLSHQPSGQAGLASKNILKSANSLTYLTNIQANLKLNLQIYVRPPTADIVS